MSRLCFSVLAALFLVAAPFASAQSVVPITELPTFSDTPASGDLFVAVDVSQTLASAKTRAMTWLNLKTNLLTAPTIAGVVTWADDVRQIFNPGATVAGINVGAVATAPSTPIDGDIWYDSATNDLYARVNGATVDIAAAAGMATTDIDTFAELAAIVADKSLTNLEDGGVWLGTHDYTSATVLLPTLTTLAIDNLTLNGNTLSSSSGGILITPLAGQTIVLDGSVVVDGGVVSGATSITSTNFDTVGAMGIGPTTATSINYGNANVTAHTFTSDGTGTAEVVLPDDAIGDAEIDFGVGAGQFSIADLLGTQSSPSIDWNFAGVASFSLGGNLINGVGPGVAGTDAVNLDQLNAFSPEGTAVLSTGQIAGVKFLREDGDNTSSWQAIPDGSDGSAVHTDQAGEIAGITEKAAPVSADVLIIEDSEAANAKKRVQVGNLAPEGTAVLSTGQVAGVKFLREDGDNTSSWQAIPDGADGSAVHTDQAGEIAGVTEKVTPVSGDFLIIEDSAAANAKKMIQIGNLPGGGAFSADGDTQITPGTPIVLDAATGDEVGLTLNYTTNKATSGDDTGLLINMTDTASPGTSLLADFQVGGVSKVKVNGAGVLQASAINGGTSFAGVHLATSDTGTSPHVSIGYNNGAMVGIFTKKGDAYGWTGTAASWDTVDTSLWRQNEAGHMGLWGLGAEAKFSIFSDAQSDAAITDPTNYARGYLETDASGNFIIGTEAAGTGTAGDLLLQPSAGNVGIGTATPAEALHVVGASVATDPTRGCLYIDTSLTNTANGTPAKLAGAGSTTSVTLNNVDENAVENRLRYTGATTAWFEVSASLSCTHSADNTVITLSFAKNGTDVPNSSIDRKVGTGGDIGALSLGPWVVQLAQNDYVEIFADADGAGTTTAAKGTFTLTPLF